MPKFVIYLLLPFSWLYGLIVWFRKSLYQSGVFTRSTFDFPIICVGNLTAGGTGKTPHIEWLIRQLHHTYPTAVLSRGYKRKTSGYMLATTQSTPQDIGDEPYQIKQKFPEVAVGVCENRVLGVPYILGDAPETQVLLMDDGFQHLSIKAGFNMVLCDYNRPYYNDHLLPAGLLREAASGANRADVIIVTKCPTKISAEEKQNITNKLHLLPHQHVYFSSIVYQELLPLTSSASNIPFTKSSSVIGLAGIAKADLFLNELKHRYTLVNELTFSDHHAYGDESIQQLAALHKQHPNAVFITTEKDAVKLGSEQVLKHINHIPIYYLPIGVEIANGENLVAELHAYINRELEQANA